MCAHPSLAPRPLCQSNYTILIQLLSRSGLSQLSGEKIKQVIDWEYSCAGRPTIFNFVRQLLFFSLKRICLLVNSITQQGNLEQLFRKQVFYVDLFVGVFCCPKVNYSTRNAALFGLESINGRSIKSEIFLKKKMSRVQRFDGR